MHYTVYITLPYQLKSRYVVLVWDWSKYVGYRTAEKCNNEIALLHVLRPETYTVLATDEQSTITYGVGYAPR